MKTKKLNTPSDVKAFMASKDRNIASPSDPYPKAIKDMKAAASSVKFAEVRAGYTRHENLVGRVVR